MYNNVVVVICERQLTEMRNYAPKCIPGIVASLWLTTAGNWSDKWFWALLDLFCSGAGICATTLQTFPVSLNHVNLMVESQTRDRD